jgi:hypothetical protein
LFSEKYAFCSVADYVYAIIEHFIMHFHALGNGVGLGGFIFYFIFDGVGDYFRNTLEIHQLPLVPPFFPRTSSTKNCATIHQINQNFVRFSLRVKQIFRPIRF